VLFGVDPISPPADLQSQLVNVFGANVRVSGRDSLGQILNTQDILRTPASDLVADRAPKFSIIDHCIHHVIQIHTASVQSIHDSTLMRD
jgi:hypothetical protein